MSTVLKSLKGLTVEGQVDSLSQRPGGPRKAVDNPSQALLVLRLGFLRRASDTPMP